METLEKKLLNLVNYQKAGGKKRPYLVGESGIGKTQLVNDFAKKNKMKINTLNVSCIDETDFMGIPHIDETTNITIYGKPAFLNCDLLFLDELDKNNNDAVEAALLSLLNDKSINGHEFDGVIVCGGNTVKDEYKNYDFGQAMLDRLIPIEFKREKKDIISYLQKTHEGNKKGQDLLSFLSLHDDEPESQYICGKSPRAIDQCLLNLSIDDMGLDIVEMHLGKYISFGFSAYLDEIKTSIDVILSGDVSEDEFSTFSGALRSTHIKQLGNLIRSESVTNDDIKNLHDYIYTFNGDDILNLKDLIHELIKNNKDEFLKVAPELFKNSLLIDCKDLLKA